MNLADLLDRPGPLIMGILNVTPDSFSDGGRFIAGASALEHARRMVAEGAVIIDIGAESTRPGSLPVSPAEQIMRCESIIQQLRAELPADVVLSIDTRSVQVARVALEAGAGMLNDVSAGAEPGMLELAARYGVPICLMHMQGTPQTMQEDPRYEDVIAEVRDYLLARVDAAVAAGVPRRHCLIDPGIGFGKTRAHNLALLAGLEQLVAEGCPVLLGTSRKRFMGALCRESEPALLVGATCATTALGVAAGVRVFRVHDVRENRQAAEVAWAICGGDATKA
jgi:dihydropteroate synthase